MFLSLYDDFIHTLLGREPGESANARANAAPETPAFITRGPVHFVIYFLLSEGPVHFVMHSNRCATQPAKHNQLFFTLVPILHHRDNHHHPTNLLLKATGRRVAFAF